jgi:hypothetical protein
MEEIRSDQRWVVDRVAWRFVRRLVDDEISALFFGFGPAFFVWPGRSFRDASASCVAAVQPVHPADRNFKPPVRTKPAHHLMRVTGLC